MDFRIPRCTSSSPADSAETCSTPLQSRSPPLAPPPLESVCESRSVTASTLRDKTSEDLPPLEPAEPCPRPTAWHCAKTSASRPCFSPPPPHRRKKADISSDPCSSPN